MTAHNHIIFDCVRPWLDSVGYTNARISSLNNACDQFTLAIIGQAAPPPVPTTRKLNDPAAFFQHMRETRTLGPTLSNDEVNGCNAIITACGKDGWPIADTAYALATAFHETDGTMRPIAEYGKGRGRRYGAPGRNRGQIPYGRGYVQLTWDENYEKADQKLRLGGKLIANYELALDHEIAAAIMVHGMRQGWFTSRDLDDDLPREGVASLEEFVRSRDIINGTDKAQKIAAEAMDFQAGLVAGGWRAAA